MLKKPDKVNDEYLYFIPWNHFNIEKIPILCISFQNVYFSIESNYNCNAYLYLEQIYIDDLNRKELISTKFNIPIRQYQKQECRIISNNPIYLKFKGFINGIFLDDININKIKSIKLFLSDNEKFNYDNIMINVFTKKINEKCIYLPFDHQNYNEILKTGSAINFDRINTIKIIFETTQNQNIIIRTFNHNNLIITNGFAEIFNKSIDQLNLQLSNVELRFPTEETNRRIIKGEYCLISKKSIETNQKYMKCNSCQYCFFT